MKKIAVSGIAIIGAFYQTADAATPQNRVEKWPPTMVGKAAPVIPGMSPVLDKNLRNFDDLDFRVYTKQVWKDLGKSHAENIVVHYPDGHTTTGIPAHIKELAGMWTFAPDNRIVEHPVRFGTADGEWTGVAGYLDGTFTKPMILPGGKIIQPTGKKYHLPMSTLGHWNKRGTMSEEFLFWDNATLMRQIGVGQ
ncbi:MAG: ester cyclase [Candidatus Sphingomonas colombiensis]|nr:ester cyclase [Sphingomonas sp.]WEK41598.1 MAG: ester cyclase [Sphingomonas sp.]